MLKRVVLFITLGILFIPGLFSQQYFFRQYSFEEGLPQTTVFCLMQDSRGYIWMGTNGGGVSRFDGKKFDAFTKTNGLSDNVVRSLLEDSKGNIWIGTNHGLNLYDGYSFRTIGQDQGLNESSIMKIIEGSNGTIWAETNDKGLFGLNVTDSITIVNYSRENGLLNSFIFDMYEDSENRLWLAMVGGLDIIEFEKRPLNGIRKIYRVDFDFPVDSSQILSISPDNEGTVWLGIRYKGLFRVVISPDKQRFKAAPSGINVSIPGLTVWDIKSRKNGELWVATDNNGVIRLKNDKITGEFNPANGLPSKQIFKIMEDKEGNTWFTTVGQGAIMFDDEKFLDYKQAEGLIGNKVQCILFDSPDIFYTGTEEGFSKFRKEGNVINRLIYYNSKSGLNDIVTNSIVKKEDRIWIGTNNGINILEGQKLINSPLNDSLPNKEINCLFNDSHNNLWIGTKLGFGRFSKGRLSCLSQDDGLIHNEIQTIIEGSDGGIWMGTIGGLMKIRIENNQYEITSFAKEDGLSTLWINCIAEDHGGNVWIGTFGGGIFKFDTKKDTLPITEIAAKGVLTTNNINSLLFINDSTLIAGTDNGFEYISLGNDQSVKKVLHYGIKDGFAGWEDNPNSIALDRSGFVWFGTKKGLVRFDPMNDANYHSSPASCITDVKLFFKTIDWKSRKLTVSKWSSLPENLILSHKENHITFDFTGFSFHNPEELVFSYLLEPQSKEWSPYMSNREIPFSGLAPGKYSFKVRAMNKFGIIGDPSEFSFVIKPPFWKTKWFLGSSGLLFIFLMISTVRIREKNLIKEKVRLEKIVAERTQEVVEQRDEITRQRDLVTNQKKEITDSINYAETIQLAVLPEEKILEKNFDDHFILYMPKDIVSGDFYWMSRRKNDIVFTAADCTGHGVPGAFMSMLGVSFLNKIVNESGIVEPSQILTQLRDNIISALKQKGSLRESKDGMDIAICSYNLRKKKLLFSGANNPLYLLRKVNDEYVLIEKKGDLMPVGIYSRMDNFTTHVLDIQKGDTLFLFSDGFVDQFGGPDGRKFMRKRFMQMLIDNQQYDMATQKEIYSKIIKDWIKCPSEHNCHSEQIDDIILVGIRI
jgi:ligand-binding sensor domain-containing protein/serine phosphatase RsbU (regulator of sigma subunit)